MLDWWRRVSAEAARERDERYVAAERRARSWAGYAVLVVLLGAGAAAARWLSSELSREEVLGHYWSVLAFAGLVWLLVRSFGLLFQGVKLDARNMPANRIRAAIGLMVLAPLILLAVPVVQSRLGLEPLDEGVVVVGIILYVVAGAGQLGWSLRIKRRQSDAGGE